jgi:uncharacterized protein YecT (DUF1311 family)
MSQLPRRATLLAAIAALLLLAEGAAMAQSPRPSLALCDPTKLALTAWDDCLRRGQTDTDKAVDDALAKFRSVIDARSDLSGQQRALLRRQIVESNDLWIRYRNHLCQNIMPILAGPKAKIYEENLGCIIDLNTARKNELGALMAPK